MLVVVTGSRRWPQTLAIVLNATMASLSAYTPPPLIAVRHGGGAPSGHGADTLADRAARHCGWEIAGWGVAAIARSRHHRLGKEAQDRARAARRHGDLGGAKADPGRIRGRGDRGE